jgi:hypothetical protein
MVDHDELLDMLTRLAELKLYGMKAAFDEIITTAIRMLILSQTGRTRRMVRPAGTIGSKCLADATV